MHTVVLCNLALMQISHSEDPNHESNNPTITTKAPQELSSEERSKNGQQSHVYRNLPEVALMLLGFGLEHRTHPAQANWGFRKQRLSSFWGFQMLKFRETAAVAGHVVSGPPLNILVPRLVRVWAIKQASDV